MAGASAAETLAANATAVVHIVAADGREIASFTATRAFSSVVHSSSEITSGATYSVYTGESVSGGTQVGTFTAGTAPSGGKMGGGGMGGGGTTPAGGRPGG